MTDLVAEKTRRALRIGIVLVALAAAGIVALLLVRAHHRKQAWRRLAQAAADVDRCMIGDPLAPGETYATRLEHISWANRPPESADPWPARCLSKIDELDAALHADELGLSTEQYVEVGVAPYKARSTVEAGDELWIRYTLADDLAPLHLPAVASDVRPPPAPVTSLDPLQPFASDYDRLVRDGRVLVWSDTYACTIAIESGKASCTANGDADTSARPLAQLDPGSGPKLRISGLGADYGVYRLAGGAPLVHRTHDGELFDGASLGDDDVVLTYGSRVALDRSRGGHVDHAKLTIPTGTDAYIAGPYAVWHAGSPSHLYLQRVATPDGALGPVIDGGASKGADTARLCVQDGWSAFYDGEVLGMLHDDRWQSVAGAPTVTRDVAITCAGNAVSFAWVDAAVHVVTCTAAGCRSDQLATSTNRQRELWWHDSAHAVVLADKVLLVHRDDVGLWIRLAPLAHLDAAHETLLATNASGVADLSATASAALLLVRYDNGIAAIRVDATGKPTAISAPR